MPCISTCSFKQKKICSYMPTFDREIWSAKRPIFDPCFVKIFWKPHDFRAENFTVVSPQQSQHIPKISCNLNESLVKIDF